MAHNLNDGTLKISPDVLISIISLAIDEIEGARTHEESLSDKLKKKPSIKISFENDILNIDAHISVLYGKDIQPLAKLVQDNIISQIETMTNVKVGAVNIIVASLINEDKN